MSGPPPKPAHLRQRTNRKVGSGPIAAPACPRVPALPNPDKRKWHPLTRAAWTHAWRSPMASQWLETDVDALGRLALIWDDFYRAPSAEGLREIRLQSALFGLSPLDRSRLQWEIRRAEDEPRQVARTPPKRAGADPRRLLMAVK